jgi:Indoleamine 2,3-dioxygenase
MLNSLEICLQDFGVSHQTGFLPDRLPLTSLPGSYYSRWEVIVKKLPILLKTQSLRTVVDALPVLTTSLLTTEREWQRAYVLLAFMTHGYIWGGDTPSEVCDIRSSNTGSNTNYVTNICRFFLQQYQILSSRWQITFLSPQQPPTPRSISGTSLSPPHP